MKFKTAVIIFSVLLLLPLIYFTDTKAANNGGAFITEHAHIVNGGFESPRIDGDWRLISTGSGEYGWRAETVYEEPVLEGNIIRNAVSDFIEIRRSGAEGSEDTDAFEGEQYLELDAEVPMYVYQNIELSPGSRLYYSFVHSARADENENFEFIIGDAEPLRFRNEKRWIRESGRYTVPENAGRVRIGFKSLSDTGSNVGNLIDDVQVKTGAYIETSKTSDLVSSTANPGDVFTYDICLKNYGQSNAVNIEIEDSIDGNTELVSVPELLNGAADALEYGINGDRLHIRLNNGIRLEGFEEGRGGAGELHIRYSVRAKEIENVSEIISTNTLAVYSDEGFEDEIYPERYYSNSYALNLGIVKRETESGLAVMKLWKGDDASLGTRPESVKVQLLRNGTEYGDPVILSRENGWYYEWSGLKDNKIIHASESNAEYAETSGAWNEGNDEEYNEASDETSDDAYEFDMDIINDLTEERYTYSVKEIDIPEGYECSIEKSESGVWVITNKRKPEAVRPDFGNSDDSDDPGASGNPGGYNKPDSGKTPGKTEPGNISDKPGEHEADSKESEAEKPEADRNESSANESSPPESDKISENNSEKEEESLADYEDMEISMDAEKALSVSPGESGEFTIYLKNNSGYPAKGLWIRAYIPEYMGFESAGESGEYGCIDEREFVSYFIEELGAGESMSLSFSAVKDICVGGKSEAHLYWELTGSEESPYLNMKDNPSLKLH